MLEKGKIIICSGLDGDSDMKPFGDILSLIPKCNDVTKLNATCVECMKELGEAKTSGFHGDITRFNAPFTACRVFKNSQVLVGGKELYYPTCRKHHKSINHIIVSPESLDNQSSFEYKNRSVNHIIVSPESSSEYKITLINNQSSPRGLDIKNVRS